MPSCKTARLVKGVSHSTDATVAANELAASIHQPDATWVLFHCSANYDLPRLAEEMIRLFPDQNVIGCTTAGEITPDGYLFGALTGISLCGDGFHVVTERISDLANLRLAQGEAVARSLVADLAERATQPSRDNTFGYLLVDGMSQKEEVAAASLHLGLPGLPMIGGSAGDGTRFEKTLLYHDGEFHENCALVSLVQTNRPFEVFKCEHFTSGDRKMVITEADPNRRLVREINGRSAAREYARNVGVPTSGLNPLVFASHPVIMRAGGSNYVRSIQRANDDESLTFFCAVDEGLVLTVGEAQNLVESLQQTFEGIRKRIGPPQLVLACDSFLRYLEIGRAGELQAADQVLKDNNVVGFGSYGEQFNGVHLNQTMAGVALV